VALPTVNDLKAYLRIEHTAEDALLAALLIRARTMLELWVDCPITGVARTAYDPPGGQCQPTLTALVFPWRPLAASAVIVNSEGTTIDASTYRVDRRSGMIYAKPGESFLSGPFAITATVGLDQWDEYATSIEPLLGQVIIDLAADLYTRRTPMAVSETGAGTTVAWEPSRACVQRSLETVRTLKLMVGL
jgi:hypothetical protein